MAILPRSRRLRKELSLLELYAIATGSTLAGGFFLLPGLAAAEAGPALVISYLLAGVPLVPAMFSLVELATAMPRAGGIYYFLDRSLGPLVGTAGGIGSWLVLTLKVAFALVGMGAYLTLFLPALPPLAVALGLTAGVGVLCLLGARTSGMFQVLLVAGLLTVLAGLIVGGLPMSSASHFAPILDAEASAVFGTAGLVYISYIGVTKIASLAEEVKDPERNLPRAVFLSLGTAFVVYGLGTATIVGLVPQERLAGDLTPVATAAESLVGRWGVVAVSIAALFAFTSAANAGVLSASRYPIAMSRDHLLPAWLRRLSPAGTPTTSILVTVGAIGVVLLTFDPTYIAKLASATQLLLLGGICAAVIVMRESHIDSYDPGYRSPGYPWMQILGIAAATFLIFQMGAAAALFTVALVAGSVAWFLGYARHRVDRSGALLHVFERLGRSRFVGLDPELRSILKEKGLREEDPFEEIVARADTLEVRDEPSFESLVLRVSGLLAQRLPHSRDRLAESFLEGTRIGMTPVEGGVALPHLRLPDVVSPELVLVRAAQGVRVPIGNLLGETRTSDAVYALFFLVSPQADPARHLRLLAQLAGRVDDDDFRSGWLEARDAHALKEVLLRNERFLHLPVERATPRADLVGRALSELRFPPGCLVAVVRRADESFVPQGSTVLQQGDRLTVIGSPKGIRELAERYLEE
jgi:APA family basic amino acid/polyamine antiporter